MLVNLNDLVKIKITANGVEYFKQYYKDVGLDSDRFVKTFITNNTDADGWTTMQLWEVAQIFGKYLYNGQMRMPIETQFKIGE